MKASVLAVLLGLLFAWKGWAQTAPAESLVPFTNSPSAGASTNQAEPDIGPLIPSAGVELRKTAIQPRPGLRVGGALAYPITTSRRVSEVPGKMWQLVNPLAPVRPRETVSRVGRLSPRPWTATVGWNPGRSAFPDETTHEASMPLLTLRNVP